MDYFIKKLLSLTSRTFNIWMPKVKIIKWHWCRLINFCKNLQKSIWKIKIKETLSHVKALTKIRLTKKLILSYMVRHGVAVWYPWRVYMSGILYGGGAIPLCLCQPDIKIKRQRRLNPCLSTCLSMQFLNSEVILSCYLPNRSGKNSTCA